MGIELPESQGMRFGFRILDFDVRWEIRDEAQAKRLRLGWEEQGGPPVRPPSRRGFGSRMIEQALAAELGGTIKLDFRPEGVVCIIDTPMPEPA